MQDSILIIPAEGDSVGTEYWYKQAVLAHYKIRNVYVLDYKRVDADAFIEGYSVDDDYIEDAIRKFFENINGRCEYLEIHAQGGFGAYVALKILERYRELVSRVFFIGGAPCEGMTFIAKVFHRYISRAWYISGIPFFADDPNPKQDPIIEQIKASSTMAMRINPKYYRNQLLCIGTWSIGQHWTIPERIKAYYIPNGDTVRPKWRDNSYDNDKAAEIWRSYGVAPLPKPRDNFSFYSLMPAESLFEIMDAARDVEVYLAWFQ